MAKLHAEDRGDFYFFRWEGVLTEGEIISVAKDYYPRLGDQHKLFDMSQADLTTLNLDNLISVARKVSEVHPEGGTPKTAFVAGDIATYSILTRYVLLAFQNHVRVEYRVFGDMEQAIDWLAGR